MFVFLFILLVAEHSALLKTQSCIEQNRLNVHYIFSLTQSVDIGFDCIFVAVTEAIFKAAQDFIFNLESVPAGDEDLAKRSHAD